jgi:hypothetical protein
MRVKGLPSFTFPSRVQPGGFRRALDDIRHRTLRQALRGELVMPAHAAEHGAFRNPRGIQPSLHRAYRARLHMLAIRDAD